MVMQVLYTFEPPSSAPLDNGASRNMKPRVNMADFGDGFSQRSRMGINNNPWTRKFAWSNLTKIEKDYIDNFFEARGGVESFFYRKIDESTARVYICTEWDVEDVDYNIYNISASFQQVYDLG